MFRKKGAGRAVLFMSYIVIARRYRPQSFDEVVGQEYVATTLKNAILENKVSHAYIFSGPRGVGKTSMARIFAKALNCAKGAGVSPCNECDQCRRISSGTDTDVIEMDAASNRKIDDIRNIISNVAYTPLRSRYKVYIIDEAHQVTTDAFNALLKTLEEPPAHVKFILATTEINKLPDTIVSRCQRFNFRYIPAGLVYQQISNIARSEKLKIDDGVLRAVARLSRGSMRDAQSILDQLISYGGAKASAKDLEMLSGAIDPAVIFELTEAIYQARLDGIINIADKIISEGKDINIFLDQLIEHFWHLILLLVKPKEQSIDILDDGELSQKQAGYFSVETLLEYVKIISDDRRNLRETSASRLWVELMLLKLAQMNPLKRRNNHSAQEAAVKVCPPDAVVADMPGPADAGGADKATAEPEVTGAGEQPPNMELLTDPDKKSLWSQIVAEVKKNSPAKVYPFLKEGQLVGMSRHEIVIGFLKLHGFHRNRLEEITNKRVVEECVEKVTGSRLPVSLTVLDDNATSTDKNDPSNNNPVYSGSKSDEITQDETIQDIIRTFEARVIKIE
jgi:DNA polymerase-3 subunit gamma/tau